jgi:hypothetical protein
MNFGILMFVILFCIPMGTMIWLLSPEAQEHVAFVMAGFAAVVALAVILPPLIRSLRAPRARTPSPRAVDRLKWPTSLTRSEMESYSTAWLRAHGWQVSLSMEPDQHAADVYLMATRGAETLAILCDTAGEELNPAAIRALAQGAAALGATRFVVLTLTRGKLPPPAEAAARRAGVLLLHVPELGNLNALAPEPAPLAA